MSAAHSLTFASAPSAWSLYPRLFLTRKPALLRDGQRVPRLEARLEHLRFDARHLAAYRSVCDVGDEGVPPAYAHVLANPLHMALLCTDAFPIRLIGLVHVAHRIEQRRPLRVSDVCALHTSIEGHRETERGQEFDLFTTLSVAGEPVWRETCTFLARRRSRRTPGERTAKPPRGPEAPAVPADARSAGFYADAGVGRRYARVSGDFNPIHLSTLTARVFGFPRAIAHGMWSLARCAAELGAPVFASAYTLAVSFRTPLLLPGQVTLRSWDVEGDTAFVLHGTQADKPHLVGRLSRTA